MGGMTNMVVGGGFAWSRSITRRELRGTMVHGRCATDVSAVSPCLYVSFSRTLWSVARERSHHTRTRATGGHTVSDTARRLLSRYRRCHRRRRRRPRWQRRRRRHAPRRFSVQTCASSAHVTRGKKFTTIASGGWVSCRNFPITQEKPETSRRRNSFRRRRSPPPRPLSHSTGPPSPITRPSLDDSVVTRNPTTSSATPTRKRTRTV